MQDQDSALLHAFVLDGRGGARSISRDELDSLQLGEQESLWLHWDRGQVQSQRWLRENSGLDEFSCDLLLEENTRPRLLPLPENELLVFLRGINRNPGAEPEDMVSVRIFADARRVISLRLRPLLATDALIADLLAGKGPKTSSELLLELARHLTSRVDDLVAELSELLDGEEDALDDDERYRPDHGLMLQVRRRAASLRRFLAPQRDLYAQLARNRQPWFVEDDDDYWNELNNRLTRYLEELELLRERVGLVLEAENRRLGERMNRIMYRFTVITGLFLPLTFLTGLLGINVGGIPGSESPIGFFVACGLMILLAVGQVLLFRRWRWL
ncbi:Mg2+ transporter protein, CorA family protein [Ectopseudomonas mendocina]|uniref:CorA family divalent cation transporter n=1 Tax=Ectopseudomonas mendocina TaxID=300 RepID=UPI000206DD85|nr:CorA family divalent cation transporter [Pseudomonas mendocina]MBL0949310.1 zinc transporter ZntB [Pseudomonas sp.]AEB58663.1 Mg2+ transporter protein, CorA family protein [Pseudomonas mendocina NK-01]MDF2075135.1 CorA family divalent cation transporter [Pseudomonas mendocina]SUD28960.1 Mg2+ transporter protein, CorA family protein [Pseudomonas mendocina]VEE15964.1 Mg2+ transporter protein, CorA family protein [Pseudomonas mendocina]